MLAAFFVAFAPILSGGDALTVAAALVAYAGQWLKAQKAFPTLATQGILLGIGFAFYWVSHPFGGADGWLRDGFMWASGLPGIASMSAATTVAPKTDSK